MSQTAPEQVPHPAPHRDQVPLWLLLVGIAGGPAAWIISHIVNYAIASYPCMPDGTPRRVTLPGWGWSGPSLWVIYILAALLCLGAAALSYRSWRKTQKESAGSGDLLEAGEGRTRFLAASGLAISLLSAATIVFEAVPMLAVPLCWR